jgi:hypothetical protein
LVSAVDPSGIVAARGVIEENLGIFRDINSKKSFFGGGENILLPLKIQACLPKPKSQAGKDQKKKNPRADGMFHNYAYKLAE